MKQVQIWNKLYVTYTRKYYVILFSLQPITTNQDVGVEIIWIRKLQHSKVSPHHPKKPYREFICNKKYENDTLVS